MGILSLSYMSYLQLARSRRIAIQFGEILIYIDTVSIGNRHFLPFSHPIPILFHPLLVLFHPFPVFSRPFPRHVPPQNLSCPQNALGRGRGGVCSGSQKTDTKLARWPDGRKKFFRGNCRRPAIPAIPPRSSRRHPALHPTPLLPSSPIPALPRVHSCPRPAPSSPPSRHCCNR